MSRVSAHIRIDSKLEPIMICISGNEQAKLAESRINRHHPVHRAIGHLNFCHPGESLQLELFEW